MRKRAVTIGKSGLRAAVVALALAAASSANAVDSVANVDPLAAITAERDARQADYNQLLEQITLTDDRLSRITAGIATLKKDTTTVTSALIQAAKTEKKLAEDVEIIGQRLAVLHDQQSGIRASLAGRQAVLSEVLGALQRMGLNPPPAILVKPEDALSSVRSAILLGAVVPELRSETETLLADLRELTRVALSIEAERGRLVATAGEQLAEKQRLDLLLEEKRRLQTQSETVLAAEKQRAEELANSAKSLQELIAGLEGEATAVKETRAAEEAAQAREKADAQARAEADANRPVPEENRLTAALPFDALKGKVALPVRGTVSGRFGEDDNNGGVKQGDTVTTQSGSIVTAPAAGEVLYAGPFRSYGQLLILDAGAGYHIVLAGMGRINVATGQTVLAGEPIGAMDETRVVTAAPLLEGGTGSQLYVEFRKDGKPVNPAAWWSERIAGRTANDS